MSLGNRVTVAILATVLAAPAGCGATLFLLDRGLGSDSANRGGVPAPLVLVALLLLGVAFVYEISRRVTGGRIDDHDLPIGAVAACTVSGLFAGLCFVKPAPLEAGAALAMLGGFIGTFVGANSGTERGPSE